MKIAVVIFLPLLILASVWVAPLKHYYVNAEVTPHELDYVKNLENLDIWNELKKVNYSQGLKNKAKESVRISSDLKSLNVEYLGDYFTIGSVFNEYDLNSGAASWQLQYSSLIIPQALLLKYHESGKDEAYLKVASDWIEGYAEYEGERYLPSGFLWNDHAVAARIPVLIEFWRDYVGSDLYEHEQAINIVGLLFRSVSMLAKESHYTVHTNHGLMQNLVLLYFSVAFPALDLSADIQQLALARLSEQMEFYVSQEGVVLEDSPGYHAFGFLLLQDLVLLTKLSGKNYSQFNKIKRNIKTVLGSMCRPDDTLPIIGDTILSNAPHPVCEIIETRNYNKFFPIAGNAVFSSSSQEHLYYSWMHYPKHGHSMENEPSLSWWGNGVNWIVNTGYWPYGFVGREESESGLGSNAPYFFDDSGKNREVNLVSFFNGADLKVVEVRRKAVDGADLTRYLINIPGRVWVVLDVFKGEHGKGSTTWTFSPSVKLLRNEGENFFVARSRGNEIKVLFESLGSHHVEVLRGSRDPFAGWTVKDRLPTQTIAAYIPIEKNEKYKLIAFQYGDAAHVSESAINVNFKGKAVELEYTEGSTVFQVKLRDTRAYLEKNGELVEQLDNISFDGQSEKQKINQAVRIYKDKYPKYMDYTYYRLKVSKLLMMLYGLSLIVFFIVFLLRKKHVEKFYYLHLFSWVGCGVWLNFVYFV